MITFDDFKKLEIKIGRVLSAEKVEGADKLLKLGIDVGQKIELVAGIAKHYEPQWLIGKEIPVLVNLEPRKIRGIESQGMVLVSVEEDGKMALLHPDKDILPGSRVS